MTTNQENRLQRIVELRMKFMYRQWESVHVDTSHSTFIEVSFESPHHEYEGKRDFRTTRFPSEIEKVIEIQQQKLLRDVKSFVGGNESMDELREILV